MQPKSLTLLKKIDSTIYQILERFQEMFDKAIIQDKSRELLAVETVTLESDAISIIRLCKDLLTITRGLRETWCLGSMKVTSGEVDEKAEEEELRETRDKFNLLIDKIVSFEKV